MDQNFFVHVAIVSIGSVLGWTGVLIWSAMKHRSEQPPINDIRAERHDQADRYDQADFVRLAGCPVSDDNVRSLINGLPSRRAPAKRTRLQNASRLYASPTPKATSASALPSAVSS